MSLKKKSFSPVIAGIMILDGDGRRIACKYYESDMMKNVTAQMAFEKEIFTKTSRTSARNDAELAVIDQKTVIYKFNSDAYFYVFGVKGENELIVLSVLNCVEESLTALLRNQVSKKTLIDNLDLVLLTVDEIVDDGSILEIDSALVVNRVMMKGEGELDRPVDQTFSQALKTAMRSVRSYR